MDITSSGHLTGANIINPFLDMIRNTLHLDPLIVVNFGLLVIGLITSLRSTVNILYSYAEKTCLSTVHVRADDPLYNEIVRWMTDHVFQHRDFLSALAHTRTQPYESTTISSFQPRGAKQPPIKLHPFRGSRLFRFRGTWIFFKNTPSSLSYSPVMDIKDRTHLTLQCLSISLTTLKAFLTEVRLYTRKVTQSTVSIYRTQSEGREGPSYWTLAATRPPRPIDTIILNENKKQKILQDIREYLHPQTRQWYANHGIPYRRGYLFSGPPGTGKTSLASAIAGVFGLNIYVLSLRDPTMKEPEFIQLFSDIPTQCVVLLEDVDAAGLHRNEPTTNASSGSSNNAPPNHNLLEALGQLRGAPDPISNPANASTISLSGLLNAIDGVSSHEGRILIMTTNIPQQLDRALIRPGRVDLHIRFELPSREELKHLFLSLYSGGSQGDNQEKHEIMPKERLEELAEDFSKRLPTDRFSIADVQGFLLQYKREPEKACENVDAWVVEELGVEDERTTNTE
ncbi:hypothetical protein AbraIFM66951_010249 [Aspergillus brasiliensis]|nr:hypothetical protein AbraIFM66951_010249 [Aspergillus brasiliensis]